MADANETAKSIPLTSQIHAVRLAVTALQKEEARATGETLAQIQEELAALEAARQTLRDLRDLRTLHAKLGLGGAP